MKRYLITESGDPQMPYALLDETGTVVRIAQTPEKLSNWAFANGAQEVAHEYDGCRIIHAVMPDKT